MKYEQATEGIRVRVQPQYSLAQSDPADGMFVFAYEIEMANLGEVPARLLFRHWRIHDSLGEDTEVDGEGVVGEQPYLAPGAQHRYESFCVLRSPAGYMEGHYTFVRPGGERFKVPIPRFDLAAPLAAPLEEDDPGLMN